MGTWVEDQTGFSIGNKGYYCGGWDGGNARSNLWEYDPILNQWTQKAKFANGQGRVGAVAFTIGNYAYMGTGSDSTWTVTKDFWKYDQAADTWTRIADFGGTPRRLAVGFAINGKGYVGTGVIAGVTTLTNDFWEYNPVTDTWIQVNSLPAIARGGTECFSIGNKGYVGTGQDSLFNFVNDFWEFGQTTLPLKLLSFTAKQQQSNVLLNWQTTNEINVSYINIQRSNNGKYFENIGKVNANCCEYHFTDDKLPPTTDKLTLYYRLEIVDKDGSKTYSEIRNVELGIRNNELKIYPNPSKSFVTIECAGAKELLIIDYLGKTVYQSTPNINHLSLNVKRYSKGVYIVKIIMTNGEIKTEKLVVE